MTGRRGLWLVPPVAIGAGIAAWLISGAEPPARLDQPERSAAATTLIAAPVGVAPVLRGFGNVRPAERWAAVAEVAGTVVWRSPELETGNLIAAGTPVLQIDATVYELAVAQAEADVAALAAQVAQLEVEEANARRILELEQERLRLAETELDRVRGLTAQGAAPQARADEQERATLQVRRSVADVANALALIPSRRAQIEAQAARGDAILARARRDLDRTRIAAPFDLRVGQVQIETHQFAGLGQPLVGGDGIASAEVAAQLSIDDFPRLIGAGRVPGTTGFAALQEALRRIEAQVALVSNPAQVWPARLLRVENALDPQARSVPVVVAVDAPYAGADPPVHLPLVPNMYVEVTLTGPEVAQRIVIPDSAVHPGDLVYLRDSEGRLAIRRVDVDWRQDGQAILAGGIEPGEEVVLDDLVPAIPGLRIATPGTGR